MNIQKFKGGFIQEYEEEQAERKKQKELREQYCIEDPQVVIVEKKQWLKTILNAIAAIIRLTAAVTLIILAAIGLIALIYPVPRSAVIDVIMELCNAIIDFLPFC